MGMCSQCRWTRAHSTGIRRRGSIAHRNWAKIHFPTASRIGDILGMANTFPLPPRLQALLAAPPLADLAFTQVPVRARHDGWSPERQTAFIHRLALCGSVSTSARAVGKSRKSVYHLRHRPPPESFAAAGAAALGMGRSRQLDLAIERSIAGEVRPYFYQGRKCGETIRYNDSLALAVLKLLRRDPDGRGWDPVERAPWDY